MKRGAVAFNGLLVRISHAVGLEGAFLALGTGLLAVGAGLLNPAGAFIVVGSVALLVGVALTLPRKV